MRKKKKRMRIKKNPTLPPQNNQKTHHNKKPLPQNEWQPPFKKTNKTQKTTKNPNHHKPLSYQKDFFLFIQKQYRKRT